MGLGQRDPEAYRIAPGEHDISDVSHYINVPAQGTFRCPLARLMSEESFERRARSRQRGNGLAGHSRPRMRKTGERRPRGDPSAEALCGTSSGTGRSELDCLWETSQLLPRNRPDEGDRSTGAMSR